MAVSGKWVTLNNLLCITGLTSALRQCSGRSKRMKIKVMKRHGWRTITSRYNFWRDTSLTPIDVLRTSMRLASYPGLLTPAFVTYLDVWRSGTFPEKQQASALPIANTNRRTTEHFTSDSFGNVSWVQKAALQLYRRNVPLLHMSRYITAHDSVLPGLPCVSITMGHWAWVRGYHMPTPTAEFLP